MIRSIQLPEFYTAFSEIYNTANKGLFNGTDGVIGSFDLGKCVEAQPDLILANGMAYRYIPWIGTVSRIPLNNDAEIFHVKPNEPTRWYIVNVGPRKSLDFNFAEAIIDVSYLPSLLNQHQVKNLQYNNFSISAIGTGDVDKVKSLMVGVPTFTALSNPVITAAEKVFHPRPTTAKINAISRVTPNSHIFIIFQ